MEIIPVIDIRNGVTVRAVAGRRADYAPLATPLAATSDPCDVAGGLMALHSFDAIYLADLDAIEGRGGNEEAARAIAAAISPARLWIDAGFTTLARADSRRDAPNMAPVIGSESLRGAESITELRDRPDLILSLDFSAEGFLGDSRLLDDPSCWPHRVIVMTLAQVGARQGPDLARLREIVSRAGGRRVYAAGGVRGVDDLRALREAGAAGALVATALHDGRLTAADLRKPRQAASSFETRAARAPQDEA